MGLGYLERIAGEKIYVGTFVRVENDKVFTQPKVRFFRIAMVAHAHGWPYRQHRISYEIGETVVIQLATSGDIVDLFLSSLSGKNDIDYCEPLEFDGKGGVKISEDISNVVAEGIGLGNNILLPSLVKTVLL